MRWVEWYVMDRMPVSYCERPLVCKNAKMQPISAATLQKFLDALYGHVREVIATTLPDKFGIALDALTTGGRHYLQSLLFRMILPLPSRSSGIQTTMKAFNVLHAGLCY
ncbi:hypothetical protein PC128_g21780 [Phytophthora cactorum]|nr:hypothetical protein PC128_g21780 [Phytophthora cactorum]